MSDAEWLDWRAKGMPNAPQAPAEPPPPSSGPSADTSPDPIGPNTRSFLNTTIAPGESGGRYDIRYGGAGGPGFFTDYSQHPNVRVGIPDTGLTSDAAGKYQFLSSTWRPIAAKLGLKDFSPESQDRAAAYLASTTYKQATGRDLETDLADPQRRPQIIAALTPQWPSLGKKGGGGTMVANNGPPAPQAPQGNDQLALMNKLLLMTLQNQHRSSPIDPTYARMAMLNSLMPQQKPVVPASGSQFPWVQAILNQQTQLNPLQAYQNALRMQTLGGLS